MSRFVTVLLSTLVCVRFSVASVTRALEVSRGNFEDKPASHHDAAPRPSVTAHLAAPPPVKSVAPVSTVPAGQPRSVTLGVSAGAPRSDVYVNGRKVGQTPFLGSTSCKTGQTIRIEIVPPKGAPLVYARDCVGGALEVAGPPP